MTESTDSNGLPIAYAQFTATLSQASTQLVTVRYDTQDGTAQTADGDYVPPANARLITFSAGQTQQIVSIRVADDSKGEDAETFSMRLSLPVNATISDGIAFATILDNDIKAQVLGRMTVQGYNGEWVDYPRMVTASGSGSKNTITYSPNAVSASPGGDDLTPEAGPSGTTGGLGGYGFFDVSISPVTSGSITYQLPGSSVVGEYDLRLIPSAYLDYGADGPRWEDRIAQDNCAAQPGRTWTLATISINNSGEISSVRRASPSDAIDTTPGSITPSPIYLGSTKGRFFLPPGVAATSPPAYWSACIVDEDLKNRIEAPVEITPTRSNSVRLCESFAATVKEQEASDKAGYAIGKASELGTGYTVPPDQCFPDAKYVALGDSYSSGEGLAEDADAGFLGQGLVTPSRVEGYFEDSTSSASSTCHRHPNAYGPVFAGKRAVKAPDLAFYACSGAITDDIYNSGQRKKMFEPAQIDHPDIGAGTELVSLTIGGNDAGFGDVIMACLLHYSVEDPGCPEGIKQEKRDYVNASGEEGFKDDVKKAFEKIKLRVPNARIVAMGYPRFFPEGGSSCLRLGPTFLNEDQVWMNESIDLVNSKIQSAASLVGIEYNPIDWSGHEICGSSGEEWLNHLTWRDTTARADQSGFKPTGNASFHPNFSGHKKGYADDLDTFVGVW